MRAQESWYGDSLRARGFRTWGKNGGTSVSPSGLFVVPISEGVSHCLGGHLTLSSDDGTSLSKQVPEPCDCEERVRAERGRPCKCVRACLFGVNTMLKVWIGPSRLRRWRHRF